MRLSRNQNVLRIGALLLLALATSCSLNPKGELPSATEDDDDVEGAPGRTGATDDAADDITSGGEGAPAVPALDEPDSANEQAIDDADDSPADDGVVDDPGDGDLDVLDPPGDAEGAGAGGASAMQPVMDAGFDGGVSPTADAGALDGGPSLDAGSDGTDGGE